MNSARGGAARRRPRLRQNDRAVGASSGVSQKSGLAPRLWPVALFLTVLLACGGGEPSEVAGPTTTNLPPASTTTQPGMGLTQECVTEAAGYRVRYPATWFSNDPSQSAECRFFHPEPFDVPPNTEATGFAIALNVEPTPFAELALGPEGSVASEVQARAETTVAGRMAVRAEITSTGEGLLPSGAKGVVYFVDFGGSTFLGRTYGSPSAGTLASNTQVLDQMMGTLARIELPSPQCSASGESPAELLQDRLPAAVTTTRGEIIEAAVACDYDGLAEIALRGDALFTYSFGGGDDPAGSWRQDEAAGRPVLRTLVRLMNTPFASREVTDGTQYVWPSAFGYERWQDVPASEREVLRPIYDDDDFQGFDAFGSYVGYRVGITDTGDWVFFVGGD